MRRVYGPVLGPRSTPLGNTELRWQFVTPVPQKVAFQDRESGPTTPRCVARMAAQLVRVPVGEDRFRAQIPAETCRAAGIRVELITGDASGVDPVLGIIQGHRLLVRADDVDRVGVILRKAGRSGP